MKTTTVKGNELHLKGYNLFHIWGNMEGDQISKFYASKSPSRVSSKFDYPKVYVSIAMPDVNKEYEII